MNLLTCLACGVFTGCKIWLCSISDGGSNELHAVKVISSLQDNVNQFIAACKNGFGMKGGQIFEATDLEDPTRRHMSQGDTQHHQDDNRKIRNVSEAVVCLVQGG